MRGTVALLVAMLFSVSANAAPRRSLLGRIFKKPTLAGKHFLLAATAQTSAMVADVETTEAGVKQQQFSEGNPVFGERPGRVKLYSILGSVDVVELFAEHHLKSEADRDPEYGRWKWWTAAAAATGFHAFGAIHNAVLLSQH